jgi:hypothetical protein
MVEVITTVAVITASVTHSAIAMALRIIKIVILTVISLIRYLIMHKLDLKNLYKSPDKLHTGITCWQKFILQNILPVRWESCITEHNIGYTLGIDRAEVDFVYLTCMIKAHKWLTPIAIIYYLIVRITGGLYFKK